MKTRFVTSLGIALLIAFSLSPGIVQAQMTLAPRWTDELPNRPNPLPIEGESLSISIDQQYATTVVAQQYVNTSKQILEGVCSMRTGQDGRVSGFAYWSGSTKIRGEVFEKESAARIYDQTTGLNRDPGLVEQTGEGAFSFRVFPIQPNEHKRIELTLGQRLARVGTHVEYRTPIAFAQARITAVLEDSRRMTQFTSATHRLDVKQSAGKTIVTATPQSNQEKEFVLGYDIDEPPYTLSVTRHQDVGHPAYLTIALGTEVSVQRSAKDVTIVLDHSGSMGGAPMTEARAAAKEIVARLAGQDRINVIAFDDQVQTLFSGMQPVTAQNRSAALRFLDGVHEGGGTDIARALQAALKGQRPNAERALILLLTDGESDAAQVFSVAQQDSSNVRVFTVGLGSGVNRPLLSRLSDMKRGRFTYIQSAQAIRPSVSRLFGLIETAALKAPALSIENGELLQVQPSSLPDLAPGEELVVTARATGTGRAKVTLTGIGTHGPVNAEAVVELGSSAKHPWVGRLWAGDRTNRILEDISLNGETEARKQEAIELAIAYGFVTPYTAFLAIPESELTESTSPLMRDMRAQRKAILAKRADAVALSRTEMPPGDPVLTVNAPQDALRVTAYFPFGLIKDLTYDAELGRWRVRFLVPNDVPDGLYNVPVRVMARDGHVEFRNGSYTIDSSEPEFETAVHCQKGDMSISVNTREPAREVWAADVASPARRVRFVPDPKDPNKTHYVAQLKGACAGVRVRVVVTDRARNEGEEIVTCPEEQP